MIKRLFIVSAALAVMATGRPALAHHSANAEFDTQKVETFTGVLTKVENLNPHGWWYFDVKGPDGKVTSWKLETGGPGGLINQGLKVKEDLKIGNSYEVKCSPAWKDPEGARIGIARQITINGKDYQLFNI
jgi:hypothetical protein